MNLDDIVDSCVEEEDCTYTHPHGRIPERSITGDYVTVPTYRGVSSAIDWLIEHKSEDGWESVQKSFNELNKSIEDIVKNKELLVHKTIKESDN